MKIILYLSPQTIDAHALTYGTQKEQKGVKFDYRNIKLNTVSREENGVIPKSMCTVYSSVLCTATVFAEPLAPNSLFEASECRFINEFSTVGFRFRPYIVDCFAIVQNLPENVRNISFPSCPLLSSSLLVHEQIISSAG